LRFLFIGDIVGKPGVTIVTRAMAGLRSREKLDLIITNAENSADGSGLTPATYRKLINAGSDCITLGDHIYRRREIFQVLESEDNIVKPANYPVEAPGKTWAVVRGTNGVQVAVVSLLGRVFMKPVDCPFHAVDRVLKEIPSSVAVKFVDFHAEATSDMQLMGRYLDGRVSAVIGTHTHVATADEQIFPAGTAFQCDAGMTGPHASILGRKIERVMETATTFRPTFFQVATDDVKLNGSIVEVDKTTGKALSIQRLCVDEQEAEQLYELSQDALRSASK
jgi:metallophosphoesterase (TIGR00282 family)